jgi:glycosyltransferase involved in cell wall biosynthesis
VRVLRVLTRANVGGPARQALALWDQDAALATQTLLAVGDLGSSETEIDFGSRPLLALDRIDSDSHGLVRLPTLGRAARPWRDLRAVKALRSLIRRFQPEVLHTHTTQAGFFGRRAGVLEGVPVLAHTYHGHVLADYYSMPVSFALRRLEARLARRTHIPLAVSPSCRDELHQMGIGDGRIQVIPPAIDLTAFQNQDRGASRQLLGAEDQFVVGFVGRMVAIKQPAMFVELLASMPDVRGVLLGDGPLRNGLALPGNAQAYGSVHEPWKYLAGMDALVLCSKREGCPLVALEAFAAGVPVVGFDVPGIRDVLKHWGTGLVVPPEQGVAGLRRAVEELRRGGASGRARWQVEASTLTRFDPAQVAAELRQHYTEALQGRPALHGEG